MAGLAGSEITIVEVQIPSQRTVHERGTIGCTTSTTDKTAWPVRGPGGGVLPYPVRRFCVAGADRTTKHVEHSDLQLQSRIAREFFILGSGDERRQLLDNRHVVPPFGSIWKMRRCDNCDNEADVLHGTPGIPHAPFIAVPVVLSETAQISLRRTAFMTASRRLCVPSFWLIWCR